MCADKFVGCCCLWIEYYLRYSRSNNQEGNTKYSTVQSVAFDRSLSLNVLLILFLFYFFCSVLFTLLAYRSHHALYSFLAKFLTVLLNAFAHQIAMGFFFVFTAAGVIEAGYSYYLSWIFCVLVLMKLCVCDGIIAG